MIYYFENKIAYFGKLEPFLLNILDPIICILTEERNEIESYLYV